MNNQRPVKVIQVIHSLGMGGAETWLMEVLRLWSRSGAGQIDFLLTSGHPGVFDDEARELGAHIYYLRYGRAQLRQFGREFRRILREGQYDAIHDHQDYASGLHFLLGLNALPKVRVTHVHNAWLYLEANLAACLSRRIAAIAGKHLVQSLATHICGTSADVLEKYGFRLGQHRTLQVSVLHCGFDIEKFNAPRDDDRQSVLQEFNWPKDARVVLFVGRLDRVSEFNHPQNQKNSWFALNVVVAALKKDSSVCLLMAGANDDARRALQSRIEDWGLRDKLRLIGVRNDIPRLMRAADALLFPSRQEGLGMVTVEAQAAGLPVLSSTGVPWESIVIPEVYDVLSLQEPIDEWAEALLRATARPRRPLELVRRVFESSAFSITHSARHLQQIYGTTTQ